MRNKNTTTALEFDSCKKKWKSWGGPEVLLSPGCAQLCLLRHLLHIPRPCTADYRAVKILKGVHGHARAPVSEVRGWNCANGMRTSERCFSFKLSIYFGRKNRYKVFERLILQSMHQLVIWRLQNEAAALFLRRCSCNCAHINVMVPYVSSFFVCANYSSRSANTRTSVETYIWLQTANIPPKLIKRSFKMLLRWFRGSSFVALIKKVLLKTWISWFTCDHLATSIYATSLILKNTVIDILLLFKGYVEEGRWAN